MQEKVKDFFGKFAVEEYRRGDIIIFAHMSLASVYYIESGTVIEYDIAAKGTRAILNTFEAKAFFPMSNVINNIETPYFFEAEGIVKLRKAPAEMVVHFVKQNPDVLYDLLQRIYQGTDDLLARLSEIMHGDAESRILQELEIIKKRFGIEAGVEGDLLLKRVSEIELAERTGLARETVSRTLQKLKTKDVIKVQKGHFILRQ